MVRRLRRRTRVTVVGLLVVAACAGDGDDEGGADTTVTDPTPTDTTPVDTTPVDTTTSVVSASDDDAPSPGTVVGTGPEPLGEGVVFDVWLAVDGGEFDPDLDTTTSVVIDLGGLASTAVLDIAYELDLVSTSVSGTVSELVRPDDDGSARIVVNRGLGLAELGEHTLTFAGVVEAVDGSFELPVERVVRFVTTEDGDAPVEELELVGGALTVEASRRWNVVGPLGSFSSQRERAAPEEPLGLALDETEVLVDLVARDLRGVSVRRSLRPLYLDDLAVLAAGASEVFGSGEYTEPVPVELGGLGGWRVVRTTAEITQTIDVLEALDEVFVVQANHGSDSAHASETAAVRDSLRFHPDRFVRLTHVIEQQAWMDVDGERYFELVTRLPANWGSDPDGSNDAVSPDGRRRVVRQSFPVGDGTLEEFVADVIAASVPDGAEASFELAERGGLPGATITIVDDPAGDAVSVILTDGETYEVTTVRDDPDDADPPLIAAIAASVRPVGPPSTN